MSTEEFVAWFNGFSRGFRGRPNAKQWAEILAQIEKLDHASPLKAWFEGLRVKVTGVPGDKVWNEIKKQIGETAARASDKKGRLRGIFERFEKNASALKSGPDAKARKK